MKNLDLNSFGVQEMNAKEMKNSDGGMIYVRFDLNWFDGVKGNSSVEIGTKDANGNDVTLVHIGNG